MKALVLVAACLAALTLLPAAAQAQQAGALIVTLQPPEAALTEDGPLTFLGTVTLTVDYTAYTSISGIPVQYTVTKQPAWATVVVSPSSDVFSLGPYPGPSASMTMTKQITIIVNAASDDLDQDLTDLIEITATTTPGLLGKAFTGKGSTPITYDAPEEPCAEHAGMTHEQMAALAVEAADTYNAYQREQQAGSSEDVTVQNAAASTIPMPWVAVGGFALVGAGIGLVLRRRLA